MEDDERKKKELNNLSNPKLEPDQVNQSKSRGGGGS